MSEKSSFGLRNFFLTVLANALGAFFAAILLTFIQSETLANALQFLGTNVSGAVVAAVDSVRGFLVYLSDATGGPLALIQTIVAALSLILTLVTWLYPRRE